MDDFKIIVGAPAHNDKKGAVYVYENKIGIWELNRKFDAPEDLTLSYFGFGLDLQNDRLVVGTPWVNQFQGGVFALGLDELTSVKDQNIESLTLFPNPSKDFIHLNLKDNQIKTVELFDMLGAKVATYNYTGDALDIRQLSAGTYVVKSNKDNTTIEIGKFVKL